MFHTGAIDSDVVVPVVVVAVAVEEEDRGMIDDTTRKDVDGDNDAVVVDVNAST